MKQTQKICLKNYNQASAINQEIAKLPEARSEKIFLDQGKEIKSHKATIVNGRVIDIPSKHYQLVQHKEAFTPVINGLTESGVNDYNFQILNNDNRASLRIYTNSIQDGVSDILLGFQVENSFNRSTTVNYGITISKGKSFVELVGYRLACSNGMLVRVNLDQAEFVKEEIKLQIKTLFKESCKLRHSSNVHERIRGMQYVVEAIALLRNPLRTMIETAKGIVLDEDKIRSIIKNHFSERMTKKILARFDKDANVEGTHVWGLYNAITYEVSHDVSFAKHSNGLEKANSVLQEALVLA